MNHTRKGNRYKSNKNEMLHLVCSMNWRWMQCFCLNARPYSNYVCYASHFIVQYHNTHFLFCILGIVWLENGPVSHFLPLSFPPFPLLCPHMIPRDSRKPSWEREAAYGHDQSADQFARAAASRSRRAEEVGSIANWEATPANGVGEAATGTGERDCSQNFSSSPALASKSGAALKCIACQTCEVFPGPNQNLWGGEGKGKEEDVEMEN